MDLAWPFLAFVAYTCLHMPGHQQPLNTTLFSSPHTSCSARPPPEENTGDRMDYLPPAGIARDNDFGGIRC